MVESGQYVKTSLYENHLFHSLVIFGGLEHPGGGGYSTLAWTGVCAARTSGP